MDPAYEALIILLAIFVFFAILIYLIFHLTADKKKLKREIKEMFNAKEKDGDLQFNYRNHDVVVTFRPEVKVSILHNRDVGEVKSPPGARLTPLYLTFKIKKSSEIGEKLDKYIEFLESIPTR